MGGRIRGTGWLGAERYLRRIYGRDGLRRLHAMLPEGKRYILGGTIKPGDWLSYDDYMHVMLAADRLLGAGDMTVLQHASRATAGDDMKGILKMLISFTHPRFVINNTARLWRQYYDRGVSSVAWSSPRHGDWIIRDYPDIPRHHEFDNIPWIVKVLSLSNARNIQAEHYACMARGDAECRTAFCWE